MNFIQILSRRLKAFRAFPLFALILLLCSGCVAKHKLVLFQDADDYIDAKRVAATYDIRIQPDDQLAVSVSSQDRELVEVFNNKVVIGGSSTGGGSGSAGSMGGGSSASGFHVDQDGYIEFPVFGKIMVAGLSRKECADTIQSRLRSGYINDAVVSIELLSFHVVVIGAVGSPQILSINKDRCTIVEALTMAGSIQEAGYRQNILIIREENGEIYSYRVDFTSLGDLINSPFYYMKQNDIVYVEPNGAIQVEASPMYRYMTALTTVASFFVSMVTLLFVAF